MGSNGLERQPGQVCVNDRRSPIIPRKRMICEMKLKLDISGRAKKRVRICRDHEKRQDCKPKGWRGNRKDCKKKRVSLKTPRHSVIKSKNCVVAILLWEKQEVSVVPDWPYIWRKCPKGLKHLNLLKAQLNEL